MSIKVVLFDLDGTLLPMDQDLFINTYFGLLVKKLALHGYDPEKVGGAIWKGTVDMVKNDGKVTNEKLFWNRFTEIFGDKAREDEPYFEEFYESDFDRVREVLGYNPKAAETVSLIRSLGFRVALATNPVFPKVATVKRAGWAGLSLSDFELCTTYENSRHCKPNPDYYIDIINKLGVSADECLMVGNDVDDDMIAETLGMKVFLLTDCLINKKNKDISIYPQGSFDELMSFVRELL